MAIEKRERKAQGRRKQYSYRVKWRYLGKGEQQAKTLDNEAEAAQLEAALRKSGWAYRDTDPEVKHLTLIGGTRTEEPVETTTTTTQMPTLYEACVRWANRPGLSASSKRGYMYVPNDRLGGLGDVRLDQLTELDLENWLNTQTDTYAPGTAFISQVVVCGALRQNGMHALALTVPKIDPARKVSPIYLEEDQVEALVRQAFKIGPKFGAQVQLTGALGPRWGESCGLQAVHCSLGKAETAHIWIRQAVLNKANLRGGFKAEKVKTRNAVRMLPLTEELTEVMQGATADCTESRSLVFRPEPGHKTSASFWYYDAFAYAWQRLKLATPEVPNDLRWHDLRHTAAKNMLERGVPIAYVSKLLGHSKVEVTDKEYGSFDQRSHDMVRRLMSA